MKPASPQRICRSVVLRKTSVPLCQATITSSFLLASVSTGKTNLKWSTSGSNTSSSASVASAQKSLREFSHFLPSDRICRWNQPHRKTQERLYILLLLISFLFWSNAKLFAQLFVVVIFMIPHAEQYISHENLNLLQDEEYRHFCRKSYFQRGDTYKIIQFNQAARNEFIMVQAAKVNTECNFKLTAVSNSKEEIVIQNIFPTDHLEQNVVLVIACSKLLRQSNYFRVWYHRGGVLRKKPYDDSEGINYVQIVPEQKCDRQARKGGQEQNNSIAFVHITITRLRLPVTNSTENEWKRIGASIDLQQPRFRTFETLTDYQRSIFVPDTFIAKHSPSTTHYSLAVISVTALIAMIV